MPVLASLVRSWAGSAAFNSTNAMSWDEVYLPAVVDGKLAKCSVSFTCDDECIVEVSLADELMARGEGIDLFAALNSARRVLERLDIMVCCNGSRRDVYPSQMLRQTTEGRRAYVLEMPWSPKKPPSVDIFDPVSDLSTLATVDEQRAWFDRWLPPRPINYRPKVEE